MWNFLNTCDVNPMVEIIDETLFYNRGSCLVYFVFYFVNVYSVYIIITVYMTCSNKIKYKIKISVSI